MSKYRIRKTGEIVTVISYSGHAQRSDYDYVSYIDSNNVEHNNEHMSLYWDMEEIDVKAQTDWEQREFDIAREIFTQKVCALNYHDTFASTAESAVKAATTFIQTYKAAHYHGKENNQ